MPLFTLCCNQSNLLSISEPSEELSIKPDECHIWIGKIDKQYSPTEKSCEILSEQELRNALRFRQSKDRHLYIAAHIMLRLVLSRYTGEEPDRIVITDIAGKKPILASNQPSIAFNLTHAEAFVVIAISQHNPVGIDVERMQAFRDWQSIAHHYFSPSEKRCLQTAPPDMVVHLFYTFWTRKEAFLKATGLGLIDQLPQIDTSALTSVCSLEDIRLTNNIPSTWQITTFALELDYCMSLALPEKVKYIYAYHFNFDTIDF